MYVLGLKCHGHDTGAALISDASGKLETTAISEARLNRKKHSYSYPLLSIKYCLDSFGLKNLDEIDLICIDIHAGFESKLSHFQYDFEKILNKNHLFDLNYKNNYLIERSIQFDKNKLKWVNHVDAHAASGYYVSPFSSATILSIEGGLGLYTGEKNNLNIIHRNGYGQELYENGKIIVPSKKERNLNTSHFYTAISEKLGFGAFNEGKTMGLASYGHTVQRKDYFEIPQRRYDGFNALYSSFYDDLLSKIPNRPVNENIITEKWINIARQAQEILEEDVLHLAKYAYNYDKNPNLCVVGGVGLSCITNRKIIDQTNFENIFIQPAASDEGIPLGCALHGYYKILGGSVERSHMDNAYYGKQNEISKVENTLKQWGFSYRKTTTQEVAQLLASGKIGARCAGKSEYGPRALGNRSIIADPRESNMMQIVNVKIKHREPFRPFAPSCLEEKRELYFDLPMLSPFMILSSQAKPGIDKIIPAVVHIDGSCRVQTVRADQNKDYYDLINEFGNLTGVYVILNTSFNDNGEAIVETYEDALLSFIRTGLDFLYLENILVERPVDLDVKKIKENLSLSIMKKIDLDYKELINIFCNQEKYKQEQEKIQNLERTFKVKFDRVKLNVIKNIKPFVPSYLKKGSN